MAARISSIKLSSLRGTADTFVAEPSSPGARWAAVHSGRTEPGRRESEGAMAREAVDEGSQRRLAGAPTAAGARPEGDSRTHLLIGIVLPASAVLAAVA